jgi:hypothetical protein
MVDGDDSRRCHTSARASRIVFSVKDARAERTKGNESASLSHVGNRTDRSRFDRPLLRSGLAGVLVMLASSRIAGRSEAGVRSEASGVDMTLATTGSSAGVAGSTSVESVFFLPLNFGGSD